MADKQVMGRFEPLKTREFDRRTAFEVTSMERASGEMAPGWHGCKPDGSEFHVYDMHWRRVPSFAAAWDELLEASAKGYRENLAREQMHKAPSSPSDGGPAFGELKQIGDRAAVGRRSYHPRYFAASALQGIFANDATISRFGKHAQAENVSPDVLAATAAYSVADAMLKERAK